MHRPHIYGSRIGSMLLMLGLSVVAVASMACDKAGAESDSAEELAGENAPATMKELTLAISGMT